MSEEKDCPTCGHDLEYAGTPEPDSPYPQERIDNYWCPRCGTLSMRGGGADVPKLVERCREYERQRIENGLSADRHEWKRLGIAESINVPAE